MAQTGRPPESYPGSEWAPLGHAIQRYLDGDAAAELAVRTDLSPDDVLPISHLFRARDGLHPVEEAVLSRARGHVLDYGAGVGAVSRLLREAGLRVTAVEIVPEAVAYLRAMGMTDARLGGLATLAPDDSFDTIVCVMNGIGLAGSLARAPSFLRELADHLSPNGSILIDSTDPSGWDGPGDGRRPGELHMQLGFDGDWGAPFPYLYASPEDLLTAATVAQLRGRLVQREDDDRYLVELGHDRPADR